MSSTLIDLWPDSIDMDVLSPMAILRFQAAQLEKRTGRVLRAKLDELPADNEETRLGFVVFAPALGGTSLQLFSASINPCSVYPMTVSGPDANESAWGVSGITSAEAYDDQELMKIIGRVLASGPTRAAINSLIAMSNELTSKATK